MFFFVGLAYALLAQLPLVNGLYTSLFPVLVYALFGTTKHLSVGTFAVVSLMVGEAISNVSHHLLMQQSTVSVFICLARSDFCKLGRDISEQ